MDELEAFAGALCEADTGFEKAKRVVRGGGKTSGVERALLAQFRESCASVDPDLPPARLGVVFLLRVLEALAGFSTLPLS